MVGTADILGHSRTVDQLWSALAQDTLHHAYLFEGPAGLGKHMLALRLAMAANCTDPGSRPPCGACPTCRQIAAGTHPDVITLGPTADRATANIPVEAIREIVRQSGYHRYNARRRFIIIDPVEAMGPSAANALLKTLEEPPQGTGFVLIASNASALLPTILSRCQRIRFGVVPIAEISQWLRSRGIEDADLVARFAQGCPGRALDLADGGLAERLALRSRLLDVLAGRLQNVFDWSTEVVDGKRQVWVRRVEDVLEVMEDLLRDVVVCGAGGGGELQNSDIPAVVQKWTAALWPSGVEACAAAMQETRDNLEVNVTGKTAVDALVLQLKKELGPACRG